MFSRIFILTLLFLCAVLCARSQSLSTLREKQISAAGTVRVDSLSIVPGSFSAEKADTSFYDIDYLNATLTWKKMIDKDSIQVKYRVMPKLNKVVKRFDYNDYIDVRFPRERVLNETNNPSLLQFGDMNYNGSFGRSLSVGNSQDLIFNSQFNLQMNGYLGDSIRLEAALTDNNLPVQPDGSTQMLNDFDRIFLQFSGKKWQVSLGDIDLRQDEQYFLRFYKRLEGISYRQLFALNSKIQNDFIVNASIAKGKFARNVLQVAEGNQGPYKLFGNNNEMYIVILAGTERVFIDGQLMSRGEDQDYVIDYNLAQISFTPKQMVTKDKRIQVEFEYSDRNYFNSMIYIKNTINFNNKLKLNVAAFSNTDAKSSPINVTIDNSKKSFMNAIGDSIAWAFYPYAEQTPNTSTKILYKKIDTLINGYQDSIYVYSTDSLLAKYALYFVQVGVNRGNYIPLISGANGQAFQWVAPINGIPQGNYEPAEFIPSPKKHQLIDLDAEYTFNENTRLRVELAGSKYDINTFSVNDKMNDNGFAGKLQFDKKHRWKTAKEKQRELYTHLNIERAEANFQPVERLRAVEFFRDWGLPLLVPNENENIINLQVGLRTNQYNFIDYQVDKYTRSGGYKGLRNTLQHRLQTPNGWKMTELISYTSIKDVYNNGFFFRPRVEFSKRFSTMANIEAGVRYAMENNQLKNKLTDSLTNTSFSFQDFSAYIQSDRSARNQFSLTYNTRSNKLPRGTELQQTDRSENIHLQAELLKNIQHTFRLSATYRQLKTYNTDYFTFLQPENSFLGRIEYNVNEWKGMLTGSFLYETGAGQEQKRAYTYIEVPAGQGQFTWKDYNEDGIAQLNEFETAVFTDEAKYIKIFTPTNEFVKANYVQLNYNILLDPYAYFGDSKNKWANIVSKVNLQSSLQTNKKSIADKSMEFNPFQGDIADSALLNLNYIFNNTLSLNRMGRIWGLDISRFVNVGKALMTYGAESRELKDWIVKAKFNISNNYTIELQQKIGENNLLTPFFNNRNYQLATFSFSPSVIYFIQTKFRMTAGYQYASMKNAQQLGGEEYKSSVLTTEAKYNAFSNTSLTGRFSYNQINFTGEVNSTVGYTMMQGLLPGDNYLWTLDMTKRIMKYLELSVRYEGRKPAETRTIHVGRVGVRAIL